MYSPATGHSPQSGSAKDSVCKRGSADSAVISCHAHGSREKVIQQRGCMCIGWPHVHLQCIRAQLSCQECCCGSALACRSATAVSDRLSCSNAVQRNSSGPIEVMSLRARCRSRSRGSGGRPHVLDRWLSLTHSTSSCNKVSSPAMRVSLLLCRYSSCNACKRSKPSTCVMRFPHSQRRRSCTQSCRPSMRSKRYPVAAVQMGGGGCRLYPLWLCMKICQNAHFKSILMHFNVHAPGR